MAEQTKTPYRLAGGITTILQGIADGSWATRPAPMAELTVGAFAMELRATAPAVGQASDGWVGRPVAVLAICRRTLMVAGVHLAQDGVSYDDVLRCLADAFLPRDAAELGAAGYWPCEGVAERVFVHARHDLVPAPVHRFRQALGIEIVRHEDYEPMVGDLAYRWSQETGIEVDPVQEGRSAITHMLAGRMPGGNEVPLDELDRKYAAGSSTVITPSLRPGSNARRSTIGVRRRSASSRGSCLPTRRVPSFAPKCFARLVCAACLEAGAFTGARRSLG